MLVIAPELAAILASMARRIRHAVGTTDSALPSVVLYDYAECQNSEPRPFFFQRTAGKGFKGTTRPITRAYVGRVLARVCAHAGLTGVDGNTIAFTAHDFRRVFATDALAAGLPPDIIQKLMGHASITTTQDYTAIFSEDVIRSHRAFIENRRQLRPAEEYREVSETEWGEFEDHFAKRKIAIGDCMRAYGNQLRPRILLRAMQTRSAGHRREATPATHPLRACSNRPRKRGSAAGEARSNA